MFHINILGRREAGDPAAMKLTMLNKLTVAIRFSGAESTPPLGARAGNGWCSAVKNFP